MKIEQESFCLVTKQSYVKWLTQTYLHIKQNNTLHLQWLRFWE